jgi:phospholipid/cholesterol/gamma-HCH transport system substrate-binding protein
VATGTNHWKLGFFVLFGAALVVAALIGVGAHRWQEDTEDYVSYFDESVQGLEVGSPVKFRGVVIGRVSAIGVAPDQRHVAITSAFAPDLVAEMQAPDGKDGGSRFAVQPGMRAQLAQAGLSGAKFILIDFFEGESPQLGGSLPEPRNYLPAAPSTLKRLEDSLISASADFPVITHELARTIAAANAIIAQVERVQVPERLVATLADASNSLRNFDRQVNALDTRGIAENAKETLSAVNTTLARVDALVDGLSAKDGVIVGVQDSLRSVNEVARGAQTLGPEMELTLREVQGAAQAIRRLADALEREPDMLIKGRTVGSQ